MLCRAVPPARARAASLPTISMRAWSLCTSPQWVVWRAMSSASTRRTEAGPMLAQPPQPHAPPRSSDPSPTGRDPRSASRRINDAIIAARSPAGVLAVLEAEAAAGTGVLLGHVNVCTALHRFAKLSGQAPFGRVVPAPGGPPSPPCVGAATSAVAVGAPSEEREGRGMRESATAAEEAGGDIVAGMPGKQATGAGRLSPSGAPAVTSSPTAATSSAQHRLLSSVWTALPDFTARHVANTLWALGRLGTLPPPTALATLLARLGATAPDLSPQNLCNALWGCARLGVGPPRPIFDAMMGTVPARAPGFLAVDVDNTLWACAALALRPPPPALAALLAHVDAPARPLGPHAVADLLWACAVLGVEAPPRALAAALATTSPADFSDLNLSQLLLAAAALGPDVCPLPPALRSAAAAAYHSRLAQAPTTVFKRRVVAALRQLDVGPVGRQVPLPVPGLGDQGPLVDVALPAHRVAVEVLGPSQLDVLTRAPLGRPVLARRVLEGVGWRVVGVPYFEWDLLRGAGQKQYYLRRLLRAVGVPL